MSHTFITSARRLLHLGELDKAARAAEHEIEYASESGDSGDLWSARLVKADVLSALGQTERALGYLDSLPPPDSTDIGACVGLRIRRGSYSGALGRFVPALHLLQEAEAMAHDARMFEALADAYLSRAFIYFLQKDYVSSERLYRATLSIGEKLEGWYLRGNALWGIGKNLMIQRHYEEALPWLDQALSIFEAAGARLDTAMVWSELGVCRLGVGQDELAMELFRKAEAVNKEAGFIHNYQVFLANIGNVYLHRRDYLTALAYYQRAVSLARQINDPVSVKKWTYNINLAYARIRAQVDHDWPHSAA